MQSIVILLVGILMAWLGYRVVKGNPNLFSKESLGNSFFVTGVLTLMIIGIVALCVMFLK